MYIYIYTYQRTIGDKTQNTLKYMNMIWVIFFLFLQCSYLEVTILLSLILNYTLDERFID